MVLTPPQDRDGFQIAIICALKRERDAVEALMDLDFKEQGRAYGKAPQDRNAYTAGVLGGKPVVLAYPREMGVLNAATVAADMRYSYRNIKIALVVGVAGGAPRTPNGVDILLGDIIISTAVIQYDFGRQYPDGFKRKNEIESTLGRASTEIANFLSYLEGTRVTRRVAAKVDTYTRSSVLATVPKPPPPAPKEDFLFPSDYRHKHQDPRRCDICSECKEWYHPVCEDAEKASCDELGCDKKISMQRSREEAGDSAEVPTPPTKIHFGRVASGNGVMKSGIHRDRVIAAEKVIGFEMEGAGTWDQLPTVVVKSVCDYADSHKNKAWQDVAAATAASCARAILEEWEVEDQVLTAGSQQKQTIHHTHYLVPRKARPRYFGYAGTLHRLAERLLPKTDVDKASGSKVFVLIGMGGVGKSETVLQFVQSHHRKFWGVFWVNCSSDDTARSDFTRIAAKCGWPAEASEQVVAEVKEHLSGLAEQALIVLDNCDEPGKDYEEYIPVGENISVVITSRVHECEVYATYVENDAQDVEYLEGLDVESAIELVYLTCKIPESKKSHERAAAERLVETLEYHPLAIIAGSSFVKEGRCSLEEYPTLFRQRKDQMLRYGPKQMQSRHKNVFATFEVSAEYLGSSSDPAARDALAMLEGLAFMDREVISEDILTRAWESEDQILKYDIKGNGGDNPIEDVRLLSRWHIMNSRIFLGDGSVPDRISLFRDARALLRGLSLVRLDNYTNSLSMHSLVHDWTRIRISEERTVQVWAITASILALSTKQSHGYEPWSVSLRRHLEACIAPVMENVDRFVEGERSQICSLLYAFSWQLYRASSAVVLPLVQLVKIESRRFTRWDEHGSESFAVDFLLALALIDERKDQEAMELLRDLVSRQEAVPQLEDSGLLSFSQLALARVLHTSGQVTEAVKMLEQVVEERKTLPDDDDDRVSSQTELAVAYLGNGQVTEALAMLEHIVKVRKALPENHYDLLASQHELGRAYYADGRVVEAVELLEHVVEGWMVLSENSPERLISQHVLADAYEANGQVTKAIEMLEHVVEVEKRLEEDHPDRLVSQHSLALKYLADRQASKAIPLLEHVVEVEKTLPDRERLISRRALINAYVANGCNNQAAELRKTIEGGESQ